MAKKGCNAHDLVTAHGTKKKQGTLGIVNGNVALAYTKQNDSGQDEVLGYTTLKEMEHKACSVDLPVFNVNF